MKITRNMLFKRIEYSILFYLLAYIWYMQRKNKLIKIFFDTMEYFEEN